LNSLYVYIRQETNVNVSHEQLANFYNLLKIRERWDRFLVDGIVDLGYESKKDDIIINSKDMQNQTKKNESAAEQSIPTDDDSLNHNNEERKLSKHNDGFKLSIDNNEAKDEVDGPNGRCEPETKTEGQVSQNDNQPGTNLTDETSDTVISPADIERDVDKETMPEIKQNSEESTEVTKLSEPTKKIQIPNAQCNLPYYFLLNNIIQEGEDIKYCNISDIVEGLSVSGDFKTISGIPLNEGEYTFNIQTDSVIGYEVSIYVNHDPRKLWVEIPSDEKVKPDKDSQEYITTQFKLIGASHRGRIHARKGTYRDDHFIVDSHNGWAISIVADGAGSSEFSSIGSKIICNESVNFIKKTIDKTEEDLILLLSELNNNIDDKPSIKKMKGYLYDILPAAIFHGRKAIEEYAISNENELKQYHTTALVTISKKIKDFYFTAAFQIGDGINATIDNEKLVILGTADHGEFVGQTLFATSDSAFISPIDLSNRIRYNFSDTPPLIISLSDGVTDSYFNTKDDVEDKDKWTEFVNELKNSEGTFKTAVEIMNWLNYYVSQEHDDRTIAIIEHF